MVLAVQRQRGNATGCGGGELADKQAVGHDVAGGGMRYENLDMYVQIFVTRHREVGTERKFNSTTSSHGHIYQHVIVWTLCRELLRVRSR